MEWNATQASLLCLCTIPHVTRNLHVTSGGIAEVTAALLYLACEIMRPDKIILRYFGTIITAHVSLTKSQNAENHVHDKNLYRNG